MSPRTAILRFGGDEPFWRDELFYSDNNSIYSGSNSIACSWFFPVSSSLLLPVREMLSTVLGSIRDVNTEACELSDRIAPT